jgi:hypothetical protein
VFLLIQLIPYGHNHTNPPVTAEPKWDSPQTRDLAKRACFDCHSNETVYPWYANIAPSSWLLQWDIDRGRSRLNFSEWTGSSRGAREIDRVFSEGEMPPPQYLLMHPEARLSAAEKQQLVDGLQKSLAQ